jgi:hypothetical protein
MIDEHSFKIKREYARILGRQPSGILLHPDLWSPQEMIVALREIPDGAGEAAIQAALDPIAMQHTMRRLWLEVLNEEEDA